MNFEQAERQYAPLRSMLFVRGRSGTMDPNTAQKLINSLDSVTRLHHATFLDSPFQWPNKGPVRPLKNNCILSEDNVHPQCIQELRKAVVVAHRRLYNALINGPFLIFVMTEELPESLMREIFDLIV
jgi:hypothetical protein